MRDLVREGKKYTDPEVVQIGRERGQVSRQIPRTLRRVREMNPEKILEDWVLVRNGNTLKVI